MHESPDDRWDDERIFGLPEREVSQADHHGEGLGGRLLDHDLAIRDAAGDACALDTHTPDNIAFYGRRGFEAIGEGRLRGGPPVVVMFRPARPKLN